MWEKPLVRLDIDGLQDFTAFSDYVVEFYHLVSTCNVGTESNGCVDNGGFGKFLFRDFDKFVYVIVELHGIPLHKGVSSTVQDDCGNTGVYWSRFKLHTELKGLNSGAGFVLADFFGFRPNERTANKHRVADDDAAGGSGVGIVCAIVACRPVLACNCGVGLAFLIAWA